MKCIRCGEDVEGGYGLVGDEMRKNRHCFKCWFWQEKVIRANDPHVARIAGRHYVIGNQTVSVPSMCRGFGGQRFEVRFFDGRIVETVDLWYQGEIPDRFKGELPDNAEFVED